MSKLDQAKQSLLKNIVELKALIAEQETIWAAIEATVEKLYSGKQTTATNATAAATGGQFVVNDKPHTDVLANYERC
jgi:hypothetical protein